MDEYCDRHDGVQATGRCHACGKPFCKECLSEGLEHHYCAGASCQAMMARHDALVAERNDWVEGQLQKALKAFNTKAIALLRSPGSFAAPVFVYLGSDGWTANLAIASAMGPLGALVLCLQMNSLIESTGESTWKAQGEMIGGWDRREVGAECIIEGESPSQGPIEELEQHKAVRSPLRDHGVTIRFK